MVPRAQRCNDNSGSLHLHRSEQGIMAEPSKVIHIRNVGHDITEDELLELVKPFGVVAKLVMLRVKNRALLQMEDMEASAGAVEYYTQANVRGRNLYLQFSSHQELAANDQTSQGQRSDQESQPNRILLVSIHNTTYPMTIYVLHQVFSPHGFVEKIATFQKSAASLLVVVFQADQFERLK